MLSNKSKEIIAKNEAIVNANIERWVREHKDEVRLKVDWKKLLSYFNTVTGKECRVINDKAKRGFRARLKEGYSKEDIAAVIKNGFNSPHHKESLHQWFTLELCSRSKSFEL